MLNELTSLLTMICLITLTLIFIEYAILLVPYLRKVGRAGRFGTKGLAISFVSTEEDSKVLEGVQARFEVEITEMPATIDSSTYSMCFFVIFHYLK